MLESNDLEIIELLLVKKLDSSIGERLKQELFNDDEYRILFNETEILINAIRISARKSTLQCKINNLESHTFKSVV
jgi:hypothetical protein